MKHLFSILLLGLITNSFAQNTFSNVMAVDEDKIEKYVDSTCWQLGRISIANLDCDKFSSCNGNTLELALINCSPEASQEEKLSIRVTLRSEVDHLLEMAGCSKTAAMIIYLGEGIFINDSDHMPVGSKGYLKHASSINTGRFIEIYGSYLSKAFPNQKIYIINWGW